MAAENLPGSGEVLFHGVGDGAHVVIGGELPGCLLEFLGALRHRIHDSLPELLCRVQQGVRRLGVGHPFLHPAVEGIGLQIQLGHGLAGGDLTVFPALQDAVEHLLVDFNGLAALGPAVFLAGTLRLLFLLGLFVQPGCRFQNAQSEAALLRAGVEFFFHAAEADVPGFQIIQQRQKRGTVLRGAGQPLHHHAVAGLQLCKELGEAPGLGGRLLVSVMINISHVPLLLS